MNEQEKNNAPQSNDLNDQTIDSAIKQNSDEVYRSNDLKLKRRQLWVSSGSLLVTLLSAAFIINQLKINQRNLTTNTTALKETLRNELYNAYDVYGKESREDDELNYLWVHVPANINAATYCKEVMELMIKDKDSFLTKNNSAEELYEKIWGYEIMSDTSRIKKTRLLRKIYLFSEGNLYNVHKAFDFKERGILDSIDWISWKGTIKAMTPHPIFISVIWSGYNSHYISKGFAKFLYSELCSKNPEGLKNQEDSLYYFRNKDFILKFYPEIQDSASWVDNASSPKS